MILFIIGSIFLICSLILFYKTNKIKLKKNIEQEKYNEELENQLIKLERERKELDAANSKKIKEIDLELNEWRESRKKEIEAYLESEQKLAEKTVNEAQLSAQREISDLNIQFQLEKKITIEEKNKLQDELDKLRASLSAGVEARLREQERQTEINFYKLSIDEADLADVKMLESLKPSLRKPVVLSKLIWTQYFQKQMTELCDRVLGTKVICGIYKITNILTEQCYIGQSVDVSKRWKDHCKCGLGIDAPSTNALYNAMQKDGVWNFSFELLETCPREQLNEKEAFWISMYQSNKFGYNSTKGNK